MGKLSHYLGVLLKGELRTGYAQLLLKMMVINIFSIQHASESYAGMVHQSLWGDVWVAPVVVILDEQSAAGYYCGMGLGLTLKVASIFLAACVDKLQVLATTPCNPACNSACNTDCNTASEECEEENGLCEEERVKIPAEVLDYLSVVLPAVRIVYDWVLCQRDLYFKARTATKHPPL